MLARPLLGLLYAFLLLNYSGLVLLLGLHSCYFRLPWPISFSLGILGLFPFLGHPRLILILHSYGPLLTLLSFLGPIIISFTFGVHGLVINLLLSYLITSDLLGPILNFLHLNAHEFIISLSLGSFKPICFPQGPFIYSIGLWLLVRATWA